MRLKFSIALPILISCVFVLLSAPTSRPSAVEPVSADVQSEVEIEVGGARILVRRGFDAELLRQVAAALGNAR